MKVYIATALERADEARAFAGAVAALGHTLTYSWWEHGSVQADGPARIAQVAMDELEGVRVADLVVVLLPGGRGTHTELGAALAFTDADRGGFGSSTKRVILVGPLADASGRECAFYRHPRVGFRFDTVPEVLAFLAGAVAGKDGVI